MLARSLALVAPALAGTQFWPRRPTPLKLQRFIKRHATARPNAPDVVKSTEPGQETAIPRGCHARRLERVVPRGDYARARACVLEWGGAPDKKATSFVAVGDRSGGVLLMATVARAYTGLLWVVNPVRESYAVDVNGKTPDDPEWKRLPNGKRYACAAYTTLGRHLLAGEERLSVVDRGDAVVVDILSVSRGRGFGRLIFPFIGPMQRLLPRAARRRRGRLYARSVSDAVAAARWSVYRVAAMAYRVSQTPSTRRSLRTLSTRPQPPSACSN